MGVNYPLFILGAVITALVIFILRARNDVVVGPVTRQDVSAPIEQIPNITQRLVQQYEGTYEPEGSAQVSTSYPGVI